MLAGPRVHQVLTALRADGEITLKINSTHRSVKNKTMITPILKIFHDLMFVCLSEVLTLHLCQMN